MMGVGQARTASGFQPGMIIGKKFALLRKLAEGGLGSVYEAHDLLIGRRVALKLIRPKVSRRTKVVQQFRREAKTTASVCHPNVVTIFEMGRRRDGSYYIAQELLDGLSLRERLHEHGKLDLDAAADVLLPIMSALAAAHRQGVVHRDVKPDNIILARGAGGEIVPKLVDFGVAKVFAEAGTTTPFGVKIGTPAYMAPEQVWGDKAIDGRVDIWAVGIVAMELLTGRTPFPGPTQAELMNQVANQPRWRIVALLPELPAAVQPALARALEERPEERHPTMDAFRRELAGRLERTIPPPSAEAEGLRYDAAWFEADEAQTPSPSPAATERDTPTDEATPEPIALSDVPEAWGEGTTDATPGGGAELGLAHHGQPASRKSLRAARQAERALSLNALEQAIQKSNQVLRDARGELRARMWLLQTVAHLWLSNYVECERCGQVALEEFPAGSMGWYVTFGHVASACGVQGKTEAVQKLHRTLLEQRTFDEPSPARDIACCRLAIVLVRAGMARTAVDLFERIGGEASLSDASQHALVRAWTETVAAEMAATRVTTACTCDTSKAPSSTSPSRATCATAACSGTTSAMPCCSSAPTRAPKPCCARCSTWPSPCA